MEEPWILMLSKKKLRQLKKKQQFFDKAAREIDILLRKTRCCFVSFPAGKYRYIVERGREK